MFYLCLYQHIFKQNSLWINILHFDTTAIIITLMTLFSILNIRKYLYLEMQSFSSKAIPQDNHYKIYFPQQAFGKPTKNRKEDPSMFDLLTWTSDGFDKHSFKKDQRFKEPTEVYLNMIGKDSWISQTQENYVNYHENCIQANPDVLNKIQNYICQRLPSSIKAQKKSPQKCMKKGDKKYGIQKDEKKQNKYQVNNYLSPKPMSRKQIQIEREDTKQRRNSIGEHQKSSKKIKIQDEVKQQNTQKYTKNKTFGYQLNKNRNQDKQLTEQEQQKLIENFKQTTRWIPNSAFTTYFGKPPFQNYGRGNTNPIDGGLVYGTYLYSHNVHPHRGKNQPKFVQSYPVALMKAKSQGTLVPSHPRTKADFSNEASKTNATQKDHKSKIQPELNSFLGSLKIQTPKLAQIQKFGGKGGSRLSNTSKYNQ